MRRRIVPLALVIALAATLSAHAGEGVTCADAAHAGGEWPSYGADLANTRMQASESVISPSNVSLLQPAWKFSAVDHGGTGTFQSTPVTGEGCVYITTSSGYIYALNADTGAVVWGGRYSETVRDVCCGGTLFAPAIHEGVLYVNVSSNPATSTHKEGPYVLALDAHTGDILWRSPSLDEEPGAYTNSSARYYDGMLIVGISNAEFADENSPAKAGGFAILDATDGSVLARTHTIPQDQRDADFGGGSIWSTAAVDPVEKYAYASTGQPAGWFDKESEFVNAIIKFDVDRNRSTFGQIVDVDKGTWDNIPYIDVDFAASPTLYTDANGQPMVTAFQKSGWLHAAFRRHMTHAWSTPLSPIGTALGNYSSQASDGKNIFAVGTYPGQLFSIDGTTGLPNWVAPVVTTIGGNPVAYANGVVYHADGKGFLDAYDAATGAPLLHRPMSADAGGVCSNIGGGVSIARNTVFSVCGDRDGRGGFGPQDNATGWVIAYRVAA